jgi:hypothetical protein
MCNDKPKEEKPVKIDPAKLQEIKQLDEDKKKAVKENTIIKK